MRLNLGCSDAQPSDYINVDIVPPADVLADLRERWPWEDSTVSEIRAFDILEHLPDKIYTLNEAWRVLQPGGRLDIKVPTTDGPGAWQDPQHCSYWNRNSFLYFTEGVAEHTRFARAYGITARFRVLAADTVKYNNGVVDLKIVLEAIKA